MTGTTTRGLARFAGFVAVAVVAAGAVWFKPAIGRNLAPKNFGVVEEGKIYRAGQLSPAMFESIHERYHIRTIIDLGSFKTTEAGDTRNERVAEALGVERYRFDLEGDATGNPNWYVHALRIMTDPAKQPVLVHCGAGSERTGCAVILYNRLVRGAGLEEGLEGARRFKHDPRRNPKLAEVLARWGEPILAAVRDGGQVDGAEPIPDPAPVTAASRSLPLAGSEQ